MDPFDFQRAFDGSSNFINATKIIKMFTEQNKHVQRMFTDQSDAEDSAAEDDDNREEKSKVLSSSTPIVNNCQPANFFPGESLQALSPIIVQTIDSPKDKDGRNIRE